MSRSVRGSKGDGYEYWGKRALSCCDPGRSNKKITLGMERAATRQQIYDEVQSANSEDNTACEEEVS
jgi:hypothetical protein